MGRFRIIKKGDSGTYLDSPQVNELHDFLNALEDLTVSPAGMGKLTMGKKNAVLDLSPIAQLVQKLQAAQAAINQTTASGSGTGGGSSTAVTNAINGIIASLNAATITGTCNPTTGAISITLLIPDLPDPI